MIQTYDLTEARVVCAQSARLPPGGAVPLHHHAGPGSEEAQGGKSVFGLLRVMMFLLDALNKSTYWGYGHTDSAL